MNGKVVQDGREIWVQAMRGNGQIWFTIVEKQGMAQEIAADVAAFSKGIEADGHVAVQGTCFVVLRPPAGGCEITSSLHTDFMLA